MTEQNNRNSELEKSVDIPTGDEERSSFGIPQGETISTIENTPEEDDTDQESSQEDEVASDDSTADVNPESDDSEETTDVDLKQLQKRADDSHKMVIDAIEYQYEQLDNGVVSSEELRAWFDARPEFSRIANKSKRLKETHRKFIKESNVSKQDDSYDDDGEEEKEKALTLSDLKKYEQDREEERLARTLKRERDTYTEEYAIKGNIKGDAYEKLRKSAEALYDSNDDWTYAQSVEAAKRALYPTKGNPIQVNGQRVVDTTPKEDEDLDMEKGYTVRDWF